MVEVVEVPVVDKGAAHRVVAVDRIAVHRVVVVAWVVEEREGASIAGMGLD